jgi:dolichol-phosphate mannosyltransferase
VVPVYNEEAILREFTFQLQNVIRSLALESEIIFVNDGSEDASGLILKELAKTDGQIRILDFSRNFGHQPAVKAGIDHARGQAIIIMDADLQDPPDVIPQFISKWREGYDVVYAVRVRREGESLFKRWTAAAYYRFLRRVSAVRIPTDVGDFRLISRRIADLLKSINEPNPYLRGMIAWLGFNQTGIPIDRASRHAGRTKYSLSKMTRLAWNGLTNFSFIPLQLATFAGVISLLFGLIALARILYQSAVSQIEISEGSIILAAVLFLGAAQLLTIGILGAYLARNLDQTRSRPLYILKNDGG